MTIGICLLTTTWLAPASVHAQAETCTDGSAVWSSANSAQIDTPLVGSDGVVDAIEAAQPAPLPGAVELARSSEDIQWCVESSDPRCSPDPEGAPAAHLAHAGELGQLAPAIVIACAPMQALESIVASEGDGAVGHRVLPERPPRNA